MSNNESNSTEHSGKLRSNTVTDSALDWAEDGSPSNCCFQTADNCCGDNVRAVEECCCCLGECTRQMATGLRRAKCKEWCGKTFTLENLKKKFPITRWLPKYRLKHFQGDIMAGLTVGLMVLPQSLAYAKVAELPVQYGLYSSFICCYVYTFFGTSKDVNLGPSAVISLLTQRFGNSPIEGDPTYAIVLAFMCGIVQFFVGIFHLGFMVDYVSHPVIQSFTQASVFTVIVSQIDNWFGLRNAPKDFFHQIYFIFANLSHIQIWDFCLGLVCMVALFLMKKMKTSACVKPYKRTCCRRCFNSSIWFLSSARNAVIVLAAAGMVVLMTSSGIDPPPFTLTGEIPRGLPPFKPPKFTVSNGNETYTAHDIFKSIGIGFFVVPLVGLVETIAIGKSFGRINRYSVDPDQELLALGTSNILGSFVSAFPITASFSRSAVNGQSGVKTPAAGLFTGTLVVLAVAFIAQWFCYIPEAALAAIIIMAVVDMIDFTILIKLWRIKKIDLIPWFVTFIVSLMFGIENGLMIGIIVSLCVLLYPTSHPKLQVEDTAEDYTIVQMDQGLRFPSAEYFKDHIREKVTLVPDRRPVMYKSLILDFCHISALDVTTVQMIEELSEDFKYMQAMLVVCNVRPEVLKVLLKANVRYLEHTSNIERAVELINNYHSCHSDMDSLDTTESIAVLSVSGYDDHSFDNHASVQDIHEDHFDATSSNF